jgi:hypothetical protein
VNSFWISSIRCFCASVRLSDSKAYTEIIGISDMEANSDSCAFCFNSDGRALSIALAVKSLDRDVIFSKIAASSFCTFSSASGENRSIPSCNVCISSMSFCISGLFSAAFPRFSQALWSCWTCSSDILHAVWISGWSRKAEAITLAFLLSPKRRIFCFTSSFIICCPIGERSIWSRLRVFGSICCA